MQARRDLDEQRELLEEWKTQEANWMGSFKDYIIIRDENGRFRKQYQRIGVFYLPEGSFTLPKVAATQARGGTYILRDPATDRVMRSGRTNDLARRRAEHLRDPELRDYEFEVVHRTDVYAEQRGLEQILHETHNPPLNKIGGIDPKNRRLPEYREAARRFLECQQGGQ
jgi:hypothetical protein